jgi:hypothetical protein
MTQETKHAIVALLKKEDKSGLAYCINHCMGVDSLGKHIYDFWTKKELLSKVDRLTDAQLSNLKSFTTYKHLFVNN